MEKVSRGVTCARWIEKIRLLYPLAPHWLQARNVEAQLRSDLTLLPSAGGGALPTLSPCVLDPEGSQLGLDLLHGHTALHILELLSSDGGFQSDAADRCKEKKGF